MSDLALLPAVELARRLRERSVGCVELMRHHLDRVARLNPAINAVVYTDPEAALARANEADAALARGEAWGPLHGLPMTVKDSIAVAGMPTTCGLPRLKDNRPERDAAAVARLRAAGAIPFGRTNVPPMTADLQTGNALHGVTSNPWDTARVPGGSSGGAAAALAAGLTPLELGSDIGGSIRNPAHFCGVYGHKPSFGIVPFDGHVPPPPGSTEWTDMAVIGPMARSAGDLATAAAEKRNQLINTYATRSAYDAQEEVEKGLR